LEVIGLNASFLEPAWLRYHADTEKVGSETVPLQQAHMRHILGFTFID
jgi:hypothetical protein